MIQIRLLIAALAVLVPASAAFAQWGEVKSDHFSIFYQSAGKGDAEFVRSWLDRTEELMQAKYGVIPNRYFVTFYLHPAPTQDANTNKALNRCCSRDERGINIGTIDYLSPSASRGLRGHCCRASDCRRTI